MTRTINEPRSWTRWADVPEYVAVTPLGHDWQVRHTAGCDQYRPTAENPWYTAPFWVHDSDGPFIEVLVTVPERIEVGEWPTDDRHLWDYLWIDSQGWTWRHYGTHASGWAARREGVGATAFTDDGLPIDGPWTRGERA